METTAVWKRSSLFDEVLYRFEKDYRAGKNPDVASYLSGEGEKRRELLLELLHSDLELRLRAGEVLRVRDYLAVFPELAERPAEILSLLAVELRFLREQGQQPQLEQYEQDYGEFLPSSLKPLFEEPRQTPSDSNLGKVIAQRYKLLQVLGQGGMGTVYLAEQTEPVKRQVALKLISGGIDSRNYITRFEAERQALAVMDHPNIARVYDGGTTDQQQPFFVMELVQGIPITQYCDQQKLNPKARLELFVQICQAVQHAHQKGIIHRDLKPGNVLVTTVDGRPEPKVIDFGLAKATEQPLTDETIEERGAVGTPAYMSPEQADPENMDVDTRTDVYALGVILYELLTGHTPIDVKQFRRGALLEMLRMVREVDPPRPSTKLSSAEELPSIAANRAVEPRELLSWVRGDIDWIVMKALEKDRNRRYETANGFAADVQRYLSGEAVLAHPPGRWYRLKKFVKRNRVQVVAAGLVTTTLLSGLFTSLWFLNRALHAEETAKYNETQAKKESEEKEKQRQLAEAREKLANKEKEEKEKARAKEEQERKYAQGISSFVINDFLALTSVKGQEERNGTASNLSRDTTLRQLLDRAADKLDKRKDLDPRTEADLALIIGESYQGFGEAELSVKYIQRCTDIRTRLFGQDDERTLSALSYLAVALLHAGKMNQAIPFLERARDVNMKLYGLHHATTLNNLNTLAYAYIDSKRVDDAIKIFEQIVPINEKGLGLDHEDTILTSENLAVAYMDVWRLNQAILLYERSLKSSIKTRGINNNGTQIISNNLALAYGLDRSWSKSIDAFDNCYKYASVKSEPASGHAVNALVKLSGMYKRVGNNEKLLSTTNTLIRELEHPQLKDSTIAYGCATVADSFRILEMSGKAIEWELKRLKCLAKSPGNDHEAYALALSSLAELQLVEKQWTEAESSLRESLRIYNARSPKSWRKFHVQSLLGSALTGRRQFKEADELLSNAYSELSKLVPSRYPPGTLSYESEFEKMHEALAGALGRLIQLCQSTNRMHDVDQLRQAASDYDLSALSWAFKHDQDSNGHRSVWLSQPLDETWHTMRIGMFWEKQGHSFPQGSVWYRLELEIPRNWASGNYYLNCGGIDDLAEFFLNGKPIGAMGNWALGRGAFATPATITIHGCQPGQKVQLAVRVFNTGGSGGIHLPIILSQSPQDLTAKYRQFLTDTELRLKKELEQPKPNEGNLYSFRDGIALAWETLQQPAKAEPYLRSNVEAIRLNKFHELYPGVTLVALSENLAIQSKWNEAESCLRTSLSIQLAKNPTGWTTHYCKSRLGNTLIKQKKYVEAEPILLQSYQEMKARENSMPQASNSLQATLDSLIQLYTETNKPDEAQKWQTEKDKLPNR